MRSNSCAWEIVAAAALLAVMVGGPLLLFNLELPAVDAVFTVSRDVDQRRSTTDHKD